MSLTFSSFCPTTLARQRQQGVSMIEVLVTVLVTSVGLLGVASLQTVGLRMARDAGLMSQASFMATNMADKMRGNEAYTAEDLNAWNEKIQQVLPNGSGEVVSTDNVHQITVTWSESAGSTRTETERERTYTLAVRL